MYQPNWASNEKEIIHGFLADFDAELRLPWHLYGWLRLSCEYLPPYQNVLGSSQIGSRKCRYIYGPMLNNKYDYSSERMKITQVVGKLGATVGSAVIGFSSHIVGNCASIITL